MPAFNVLVLPGDGIGPEVTAAGRQVLEAVASRWGHAFRFSDELVGGASIDAYGHPLGRRRSKLPSKATRCCSAPSVAPSGTTPPCVQRRPSLACARPWASTPTSVP